MESQHARITSPAENCLLMGYSILGGAYDLTQHVAFFGRIENLTNKRYEEVFGYGSRGRAFFIGLEAKT